MDEIEFCIEFSGRDAMLASPNKIFHLYTRRIQCVSIVKAMYQIVILATINLSKSLKLHIPN